MQSKIYTSAIPDYTWSSLVVPSTGASQGIGVAGSWTKQVGSRSEVIDCCWQHNHIHIHTANNTAATTTCLCPILTPRRCPGYCQPQPESRPGVRVFEGCGLTAHPFFQPQGPNRPSRVWSADPIRFNVLCHNQQHHHQRSTDHPPKGPCSCPSELAHRQF